MDQNTVKYMIEEQQQEIDRQREQLTELAEENKQLAKFKETHKQAIINLLHEHMDVEKIAVLLACDVSYVEQIKTEEKL